jgi:translation initiation factor IF-3
MKNQFDSKYAVGYFIKARNVLCIDSENVNRGVLSLESAMSIAKGVGLDLVQVVPPDNNGVPTCRIIDYSKFRYEQEKKLKAAEKKQRENAIHVKELKFRPCTGDNDLQIKAKQAKDFIDEGNHIKISILFKGRELSHREVGMEMLRKFVEMVGGAELIMEPTMNGRQLCSIIAKSNSQQQQQQALQRQQVE